MFAEGRDSIAAALSTVDGVTGYASRPTAIAPGAAWPLLAAVEHGPGAAFSATWRVLLVLAGDERTAAEQIDAILPDTVAALSPVLYVDRAEPVNLDTEAGPMLALQITGRSE